MKLKVYEVMSSISKNDKMTWEKYVASFKNFNLNFKKNKLSTVDQPKKTISRKHFLSNQTKSLKQGKIEPEGVLDLHGHRLQSAKISLQKYILNAYENNIRNILIITGKGRNSAGVLKKEVPLWLNDKIFSNLLINYETAPKKFGGEGALLVRIKNKNKSRLIKFLDNV